LLYFKESSLILSAIINIILGFYVLAKRPQSNINRSFAAYAFSLSLWSLSAFLFEVLSSRELLILAGRMAFFLGGFSGAVSIAFIIIFCQEDRSKPILIKTLPVFLIGLVFSALGFTPLVMKDIVLRPWGNDTVLAPGYKIYVFYISVIQGFGIIKLVQRYKKVKRGLEQLQIKYLVFAFGIIFPIGGFLAGYLPFITHSGKYFYLGNLSSIFIASLITYAIIRHRLLEIEVVVSRTLSLIVAVLGIFSLLLALDYFLYNILHLPKPLSILFSAIILTILIGVFQQNLDTWVKRIFFKDIFGYQIALKDFSHQLTTILDLPRLENFIVERIGQIMRIDKVSLLLLDDKQEEYRSVTTYPPEKDSSQETFMSQGPQRAMKITPSPLLPGEGERLRVKELFSGGKNIPIDSPACKRLRERQEILVLDELSRFLPEKESHAMAQDFHRLSSKLLIPLIYRGELKGIISLGSKLKGGIYSDDDINLLEAIRNEAGLALENAKLYNEVLVMRNNYEMILQQMDSGVIAANPEGIVVTFNSRAGEILDLEPQAILGQKIDRLGDKIANMFRQTLRGQRYYNKTLPFNLTAMKEKKILSISSSCIKDREGEISGGLLVFSDITEISRLEEEVRQREKLATVGSMAARVAHEIRNPLVSIKTFCQVLPDKYQDQGFREVFLPLVIKEVDRITNITEDLLSLSRVSPKVLKSVAIGAVLEESLALVKKELRDKEILVNKNYTQENIILLTDPDKLKQVFLNLFNNSIQAMDKGGTLTISTELENNGQKLEFPSHQANSQIVFIRISDTGRGIPEEYLSDIFEPFFTTKEKGTGLGLVISKEIVNELKGSIEVESQPGAGSTFIIRLPLSIENFGEAFMPLQGTKDNENVIAGSETPHLSLRGAQPRSNLK